MLLANLFNLVFVILLTEIYLMFDVNYFQIFLTSCITLAQPGLVWLSKWNKLVLEHITSN